MKEYSVTKKSERANLIRRRWEMFCFINIKEKRSEIQGGTDRINIVTE